ncbi:hypothetical protein KKC88_02410 [Patescibacteria group bacterium]|nr:hypothetical protein [Patescibacteria group bacterium]MBU1672947.1 hypothetical protein [Patescibacteria group bacterium]
MNKKFLLPVGIILFSLVFMGALCGNGNDTNENSNANENVNINVNEEAASDAEPAALLPENPFTGEWSMTTEEDGITVTTTLIVNDDGSRTVPDIWVGTVDSVTSKVTGPDVSATVGLSEEFGLYRVEGDNLKIDAANGTTTFTGNFTSDTTAEGTWIHNQRGTGGTWKATKTE